MKNARKIGLIQKSSKSFFYVSIVLMVASTIFLYFFTKELLQQEVEEELYSTMARAESSLQKNRVPFSLPPVIEIREVGSSHREFLKDTLIYDPSQDEMELFRELSTYQKINNSYYQITVRALVVESDNILMAIVVSYITILLLAFLILFYFNRAKNQQLWAPFFKSLEQMKQFALASEVPIHLVDTEIQEFSELNKEVSILTDKVRSDYKNLKQFTEDVSHEIQTPLAIIQAKIENIMNGNDLNNRQFEHLASIQKDIQRLAQLNKKLILLTKIDNNQFVNMETVNITDLVEENIKDFQELSETGISYSKQNEISVKMDMHLASVLCTNLISNAIKHNTEEKTIEIIVNGKTLSISNQGKTILQRPEMVFGRFYRETSGIKSTGLGLAISKKICDLYGFALCYSFKNERHFFEVEFADYMK